MLITNNDKYKEFNMIESVCCDIFFIYNSYEEKSLNIIENTSLVVMVKGELFDVDLNKIVNVLENEQIFNIDKLVGNICGDFLLLIYDKRDKSLHCYRDQMGHLPCYYLLENKIFYIFTSYKDLFSIKNDKMKICIPYILQYIIYCPAGYLESKYTPFQGIFRINPGNCIVLKEGVIIKYKYYNFSARRKKRTEISKFEDAVKKAIKMMYTQTSVVPLSGGLDSSLILNIASQVSTGKIKALNYYSESDPEQFDESEWIDMATKSCLCELIKVPLNHSVPTTFEKQSFIDSFYDEPGVLLNEDDAIKIAKVMKKNKIDSALYGFGENIYSIYKNSLVVLLDKTNRKHHKKLIDEYMSGVDDRQQSIIILKDVYKNSPYIERRSLWDSPIENIYDLIYFVGLAPYNECHGYFPVESIEVKWRYPLHNKYILEYFMSHSTNKRLLKTYKYHLKKIAKKYIDERIIKRPKTSAYSNIYQLLVDYINETSLECVKQIGVFDEYALGNLLDDYRFGKNGNTRLLFALVSLDIFLKTNNNILLEV